MSDEDIGLLVLALAVVLVDLDHRGRVFARALDRHIGVRHFDLAAGLDVDDLAERGTAARVPSHEVADLQLVGRGLGLLATGATLLLFFGVSHRRALTAHRVGDRQHLVDLPLGMLVHELRHFARHALLQRILLCFAHSLVHFRGVVGPVLQRDITLGDVALLADRVALFHVLHPRDERDGALGIVNQGRVPVLLRGLEQAQVALDDSVRVHAGLATARVGVPRLELRRAHVHRVAPRRVGRVDLGLLDLLDGTEREGAPRRLDACDAAQQLVGQCPADLAALDHVVHRARDGIAGSLL